MGWITTVGAFIQLVILILKNKFERDAEEKAKKEELHAEVKDAIKSKNLSAVNLAFERIRMLK